MQPEPQPAMEPEPEPEPAMEPEPEPEPESQLLAPLRCRIDSDSAAMQALHELHGWVPGAESIRPHPDVLEEKQTYLLRPMVEQICIGFLYCCERCRSMFSWSEQVPGQQRTVLHFRC